MLRQIHTDRLGDDTSAYPHVSVRNFGPVSKGSITLRPLTIFIGPNNSGKSYVAKLIHLILTSGGIYDLVPSPTSMLANHDIARTYAGKMLKVVRRKKKEGSFNIPPSLVTDMFLHVVQTSNRILEGKFVDFFGSSIPDLVQIGQKSSAISVMHNSKFDIRLNDRFNISTDLKPDIKYKVVISHQTNRTPGSEVDLDSNTMIMRFSDDYESEAMANQICVHIIESLNDTIKSNITSYYLPASKSGILQDYKALSAGIILAAQHANNKVPKTPMLTGTARDYISTLLSVGRYGSPTSHLAEQMDHDMLGGYIKLDYFAPGALPEVRYATDGKEMPLHHTSSTIGEIAPLSLYMKYVITHGDMMIIEEPETHLDHQNQIILAKYIVRMIRSGIKMLLTTHSQFLMEQLANFVLVGKVDPKIRSRKLGIGKDDYLNVNDVAAYYFSRRNIGDHVITPLKVDYEYGISQEVFVRSQRELYDNFLNIRKLIPGN